MTFSNSLSTRQATSNDLSKAQRPYASKSFFLLNHQQYSILWVTFTFHW